MNRIGNFMSNGVGKYNLTPPCKCGVDTIVVDDYTQDCVKCPSCGVVLFDEFNPSIGNKEG